MILLHSIALTKPTSNYNTLEEVLASTGPLTFDGVYRNVYEHREHLRGRGGILFVIGGAVGGNNRFDVDQHGGPLEHFCSWDEIGEVAEIGGFQIGWHTFLHPDLTTLNDDMLRREVEPPCPMKHFAYPYGRFDERVIEAVKAAGFKQAWSVNRGDDSQYQRRRWHI